MKNVENTTSTNDSFKKCVGGPSADISTVSHILETNNNINYKDELASLNGHSL